MTSKLIEALNKCETQKSYENVRYTLIDDELRDYIEESLERLEALKKENKKWREIVGCDLCEALGREILLEENEKLKKAIEILKDFFDFDIYAGEGKGYIDCCVENPTFDLYNDTQFKQYELLKEVLGE